MKCQNLFFWWVGLGGGGGGQRERGKKKEKHSSKSCAENFMLQALSVKQASKEEITVHKTTCTKLVCFFLPINNAPDFLRTFIVLRFQFKTLSSAIDIFSLIG